MVYIVLVYTDFIFFTEHPHDWLPFLTQMTDTQSFSQFVDERVLLFKQDQGMYVYVCVVCMSEWVNVHV